MTEKKKTESARTKKSDSALGSLGGAVEYVLGGMQGIAQGVMQSARHGVERYVQVLLRRIILVAFFFLGVLFFLVGLARILDAAYQLPGLGEIVVGIIMGSVALLLSMVSNRE